mmetsp:Transcript_61411/g.163378  ORF Transcript_61411/g.163378 Transcript_61411/m.163378 type:complete len:83 (+) Transcript_61411:1017-1265(+)
MRAAGTAVLYRALWVMRFTEEFCSRPQMQVALILRYFLWISSQFVGSMREEVFFFCHPSNADGEMFLYQKQVVNHNAVAWDS